MKALLKKLGFNRRDPAAEPLYLTAVQAARQEIYFTQLGVPDTVDGRFDMISLTVALVNRRIGLVDPKHTDRRQNLAQDLFDVMFVDMKLNLREMGVSDEGMKYRIKPMASAYLGRVKGYSDALAPVDEDERLANFKAAVERNIYRDMDDLSGSGALSARAIELSIELDGATDEDILEGRFVFANLD